MWGLFVLLAALVVALVYAAMRFNVQLFPLPKDLQDLTRILLISGVISIGLGAIGFFVGLGKRIPSLTISMAVVYLVGAAVVGVNVWYAAFRMFINKEHDLTLLAILLVFSAVISLFFAFFLSQSIVSRLRALLAMSQRVAEGDLSVRVDASSRDEIGRLGAGFFSRRATSDNHQIELL
jgi:methyl-accepting chemotaxis protein